MAFLREMKRFKGELPKTCEWCSREYRGYSRRWAKPAKYWYEESSTYFVLDRGGRQPKRL